MSKIQKLKKLVLTTSAYDCVDCAMDSFDPYIYLERSKVKGFAEMYSSLTDGEKEEYEDWESALLYNLSYDGDWVDRFEGDNYE